MKYKMNTGLTPFFTGTYESQWEPREYDEAGQNEVETKYKHSDLMKSIAKVYAQHEPDILAILQESMPFIRGIDFTGDTYSPREYNFETDSLDYILHVNKGDLMKTVHGLKDDAKFSEYLRERYSTRDGFISFTPNNYDALLWQIETNGDEFHQSLAALMNYLEQGNATVSYYSGAYQEIEADVLEYWSCNGYGGLNYTVAEQGEVTV